MPIHSAARPRDDLRGATIAFDLDGTLVDTVADLHRTLSVVLISEGLLPLPLSDVRKLIGNGSRTLIARAGAAQGRHFDDARLDALFTRFLAEYASDIPGQSRPFHGVEAALDELQGRGARLAVCTNKQTSLSNQLLELLGLRGRFKAVVGSDVAPVRKPHPDHFYAAIAAAGGDLSRSLMIGDSAADVKSARGAGAPVAVVSFGYTDTAPELLGADAVFDHFSELPALVSRLMPQARPRM